MCLDSPLQINFFVLQYGKLRVLEFLYLFIDKYIDRANYEICSHDTDSLYIAFSELSLEAAVKCDMRVQFYQERSKWLPSDACDVHYPSYVSCQLREIMWQNDSLECCKRFQKYMFREPGLFKIEFKGTFFLGLNSKTYFCSGDTEKYSSKGLSKRHNKLKKEDFVKVLSTKISHVGENVGFIVKDNRIVSYSQKRTGLVYLYVKRVTYHDTGSTTPLLI